MVKSLRKLDDVVWMVVSALLFALMAAAIKGASATASVPQTVFFRSALGLPLLAFVLLKEKIPIRGTRPGRLFMRGIVGLTAMSLSFYSLSLIPLGNATILVGTAPIFVALLSPLFGGEKVRASLYAFLPIFTLGVALIVKPSLSFDWLPSLAGLTAGILGGVTQLLIKDLSRTERSTTIVFYFTAIAALASFPVSLLAWNPLSPLTLVLLAGAAVSATGGQLAMTRAFHLGRASRVSLYGYAGPLFGYLLGILFFGEHPDIASALGAALLIGSGVAALRL